jgi:peptide/nickel transport system substrate-binding protein
LEPSADRHLSWLNSALDVTPGASGTNHVGFRNETFDKLLEEYKTKAKAEAISDFKKMQDMVAGSIPYVPTMVPQEARIIRSEWTGYETVMAGGPFYIQNRHTPLNLQSKSGKKVFTMAFGSDIRHQNPIRAQDHRSYYVINTLIYEPIVALNEKMEIIPWLAKNWSEQDGGRSWIFTIRDNVKWHDGNNMSAKDVVFSFNYYLKNKSAEYKPFLGSVEEVVALPNNKVKFTLKQPNIWFLKGLITPTILPQHIWAKKKPDWANPNPVGTGPFKFVKHEKDAFNHLSKNESYWQQGKPKIDEFWVKVIPSADSRFLGMKSGKLDTERYGSSPSLVQKAKSDKDLAVVISGGIWDQQLGLNLRRPPFDDPVFRKAIAHAVNREQVVKVVMAGYAEQRDFVCHPLWHTEWANMDSRFPSYNPEKAKEILKNAGYLKD